MSRQLPTVYGIALMLSEDKKNVCCLVQQGTGNTAETSNLVERWFSALVLGDIVKGFADEDDYIRPARYFRIETVHELNRLRFNFFHEEETEELKDLFKKPDYFEGIDLDSLNGE